MPWVDVTLRKMSCIAVTAPCPCARARWSVACFWALEIASPASTPLAGPHASKRRGRVPVRNVSCRDPAASAGCYFRSPLRKRPRRCRPCCCCQSRPERGILFGPVRPDSAKLRFGNALRLANLRQSRNRQLALDVLQPFVQSMFSNRSWLIIMTTLIVKCLY